MKYVFAAGFLAFMVLGVIATVIDIFYIYGVVLK